MEKKFHVEYKGVYKDFKFYVVLQRMGHRCGYVVLPSNHICNGLDYDEINVSVHGGLTYADKDYIDNGNDYMIGFDCAHCYDASDYEALDKYGLGENMPLGLRNMLHNDGEIRTLDYVKKECESLIEQLLVYKRKIYQENGFNYLKLSDTEINSIYNDIEPERMFIKEETIYQIREMLSIEKLTNEELIAMRNSIVKELSKEYENNASGCFDMTNMTKISMITMVIDCEKSNRGMEI